VLKRGGAPSKAGEGDQLAKGRKVLTSAGEEVFLKLNHVIEKEKGYRLQVLKKEKKKLPQLPIRKGGTPNERTALAKVKRGEICRATEKKGIILRGGKKRHGRKETRVYREKGRESRMTSSP